MQKISEFLYDYAFSVDLNMNDVFAPASDRENVDISEIPGLLHIEERFGSDGVIAFVGVKRGYDPCWRGTVDKKYLNAKKYIEENFVFDEHKQSLYLKDIAKPICDGKDYYVDLMKFIKENGV